MERRIRTALAIALLLIAIRFGGLPGTGIDSRTAVNLAILCGLIAVMVRYLAGRYDPF